MRRIGDPHAFEENEWIGIGEIMSVVKRMDPSVLGEDPPVGIAYPALELKKIITTETLDPGIAQEDQVGFEMLGQGVAIDCIMRQPAARSISRTDERAQLITAVVSTLRIASSWQKPTNNVFTPAESTSVSSVRLPTPIMIAAWG